jgi:hypothetical protein
MQGSLIAEIAETDFDEVAVGGRKKYRRFPKEKTKVHLAHVKIIDGSGEILYRNDNILDDPGHAPSDVRVVLATTNGVVNIASVGNNFEVDVPGNKKLDLIDRTNHPEDQPIGTKRKARFRYRDDPSSTNPEPKITGVKVTKGAATILFELNDLTDLPSKGEELRVMIWLEET